MRRITTLLACLAACSLGISTAMAAGPGCSGQKEGGEKTASCTKAASGCSEPGEFPHMVRMVGDKSVECPMTAEKMAKESNTKVMFAVAGQKFEKEGEAWAALADNSEMFVKHFATIACVMDGKTYYVCDDGAKCCADKSASACTKGGEMKTASAGASCHGDKQAKLASADDKPATCTKKEGEQVAMKDSKSCCATKGKLASAEEKKEGCGKGCVSKTGDGKDCCGPQGQKMAVIDAKTCAEMCKTAKDQKFMVAGNTYKTWDEAAKAREQVITAIHTVSMKYIVDGKEVDCASKVCPTAKSEGKVKYVVGKKQMDCELMARVELAKAQFEAAKAVNGTKAVATKM
ncbi:MAG: hypothetical protein KF841_02135 [Phycisphaerae bacterium]|nr:hypothetical protein [Phycisphaerae bacterium]